MKQGLIDRYGRPEEVARCAEVPAVIQNVANSAVGRCGKAGP
jgi:hypothetical protein